MTRRYVNHGNFGIRGVNRVSLLETVSTGLFSIDYWQGEGKRIRRSLETHDLDEAKRKVAEIIEQMEQRGRDAIRPARGETILYVVRRGENGPIKVGITRQLKGRLSQLQNGNAEKLQVLRVFTMKDVEKAVHADLERQSRLEGEWFPKELLPSVDQFFRVALDVAFQRAQKRRTAVAARVGRMIEAGLL
jgi:hypothetical protein